MIPQKVSRDLASTLSTSYLGPDWDGHEDLLLWVIFIGTVYSDTVTRNVAFISMLRDVLKKCKRHFEDSRDFQSVLRRFSWSEKKFSQQGHSLWQELKDDNW